jgi:hypothetical protein
MPTVQDIDIVFTNRKATVANIHAADALMQRDVRNRVVVTGGKTYRRARALCNKGGELQAYDTGRFRRSITLRLSKDNLVYEVYYDRSVFIADGEPYYAPYIEYGTIWMAERPVLWTAWHETYATFNKELSEEIQKSLRRRERAVLRQSEED